MKPVVSVSTILSCYHPLQRIASNHFTLPLALLPLSDDIHTRYHPYALRSISFFTQQPWFSAGVIPCAKIARRRDPERLPLPTYFSIKGRTHFLPASGCVLLSSVVGLRPTPLRFVKCSVMSDAAAEPSHSAADCASPVSPP